MLSPLNSGCTIPFPHARDLTTFRRLTDYPYENRKRLADPFVELAVDHSVPDIRELVTEVREIGAGKHAKVIWNG